MLNRLVYESARLHAPYTFIVSAIYTTAPLLHVIRLCYGKLFIFDFVYFNIIVIIIYL